tara:strand:+ start:8885 stop:11773 length:2889 start_codon:yes stop_codon:yes gene_type:complete
MPGSLRATIGDVDATVQGRPGHITRYEHAILQQLADLAAQDYQRLPSKIAARTPIQQYVSDEVMKMLGTLSHNVEGKAQDQRRQAAEQRQIYKIIKQNERLSAQQRKAPAPQVAADRNEEQRQRDFAIRNLLESKIPTAGPLKGGPSLNELAGLSQNENKREVTRLETLLGLPLTNVSTIEYGKAKQLISKYTQDYREKYLAEHPEIKEEAEKLVPAIAVPKGPLAFPDDLREMSSFKTAMYHPELMAHRDPVYEKRLINKALYERDRLLGLPKQGPGGVVDHPELIANRHPVYQKKLGNQVLRYNDYLKTLSPEQIQRIGEHEQEKIRIKQEQEPIVRHPMDVGINEEEKFPDIEPDFETLRHESFDPMVDEALRDNFSLGQQEIKASFSSRNKHLRDMILAKTLDVGESPLRDAHEIGSFLSDKYRGMSSSVLDEMTENYLSNILPKANLGYMGGSWNSPQRRTHNEKVLSNLHKDVSRNLINLEAKTAEKGLEEAGQQRTRQLYAAKSAAEMLNQQQQEASRGAETLANLEKTKIGSDLAKIEAARTLGAEEQNFEGSRLEETQREALRQQEYPLEMIERQLGASRGVPTASYATHQQISQQPNYAAIGAGGIGNMATAMMYTQQLQQRKSGGLIQKYAPGGFVLPKVENDQQTQLIEQEAQSLMNEPYNPQQALLHGIAKAGDKIAERYTGMPGIAGDMADTHLAHQEAHAVKRARGLNLIQQVQASRVKQQNFLAELEYKNKHHSETLGETSRHNKAMESLQESRGGSGSNGPGGGSITDRKAAREAVAALRRSKSMKRELSTLSELSSKIKTGPVRGLLNSGYLKGEDANKMEVGANKLILDMHQGMKNIPRSEEFMKRIESTKPNVNNYPEANKMALKMMAEGVDDIEQNSIDTLLSAGYTMEDIQHILRQDHEESSETEVSDGMINVISPEGIPGKLPAHNLEKAIARGYKRAA